ncbi:MAG: arginine--tRNA ligase [Bacteroidales bacterium]|nr:arginine--tRNA ligase [Bacteroidales bacterium]MCB9013617.1 arginine--tRNA ligase [Bacteroidales bacterium]
MAITGGIEEKILSCLHNALQDLYGKTADANLLQLQKTKKEFKGDFTLVVFPLLRITSKNPEQSANELGQYLQLHMKEVSGYNVIKGFLNLEISSSYWLDFLGYANGQKNYGLTSPGERTDKVMVEYSSPNTNKPLHLGHIRNNLLGFSISRILEANGNSVVKVNLVNDRGIHICKSMLAYQKFGNGENPASPETIKGDHLVGKYYVKFDQEYKREVTALLKEGMTQEEAEKKSALMNEAREMLRKWEAGDPETIALWKMMNGWVYEGFDETYKKLGVEFDRIYYESDTYSLGKAIVLEGLEKGVLSRRDDGSVWVDLTAEGMDQKLLLRSDGTTVYMTQDIGTAQQRFEQYSINKHIYVVGNEQNYHFQVLSLVLKKLGYEWYDKIFHLSYGMVELPEGKMKSREGTVVDADDLVEGMILTARQMSEELGKLSEYSDTEKENIYCQIGLGALKYFILKVDPKKNMMFDPKESIDFNGNTGPFIQYTYARIQSLLRKAGEKADSAEYSGDLNEKEISLLRLVHEFPEVVSSAGDTLSPALIANYLFELAKEYNQFYHENPILTAEDATVMETRLGISKICGELIKNGMYLLGIEVPERM